jgi:hypothetical protein
VSRASKFDSYLIHHEEGASLTLCAKGPDGSGNTPNRALETPEQLQMSPMGKEEIIGQPVKDSSHPQP